MQSILHEDGIFSTFDTIRKGIKDITDADKEARKNSSYIGNSISNYARKLTMSFPVLCDDSLDLHSAGIISRANEKNIASMLEMLFTSMSMDWKGKKSGAEVIATFHKNIDAMSIDDYIDYANDLATRARFENKTLGSVSDVQIRDCLKEMAAYLRSSSYNKALPVESFNETSLNDYLTRDSYGDILVHEMAPGVKEHRDQQLHEYRMQTNPEYAMIHEAKTQNGGTADKYKEADLKIKRSELALKNRDLALKQAQNDYNRLNDKNEFRHKILDADFKKANELIPTPIVVNYNILGGDGNTVVDKVSFVAGVKCRLVATTSRDIIERLTSVNKTKMTFKDLIRATTGEIKFTKDFLLAIDQQKIDARNSAKDTNAARLWNVLKKRSVKNSANKALRNGNDATAITTLIVSQDTANILASVEKFDITLPKNAKSIMDAYNLLCLIVADDTNEVAKFLYDGNTEFESISYTLLTKEALDQHYKKEINLLNQR